MAGPADAIIADVIKFLAQPMSQNNTSVTVGHMTLFFVIILVIAYFIDKK